jgi:hypothetical protein
MMNLKIILIRKKIRLILLMIAILKTLMKSKTRAILFLATMTI